MIIYSRANQACHPHQATSLLSTSLSHPRWIYLVSGGKQCPLGLIYFCCHAQAYSTEPTLSRTNLQCNTLHLIGYHIRWFFKTLFQNYYGGSNSASHTEKRCNLRIHQENKKVKTKSSFTEIISRQLISSDLSRCIGVVLQVCPIQFYSFILTQVIK